MISLDITFFNARLFRNSITAVAMLSPSFCRLSIRVQGPQVVDMNSSMQLSRTTLLTQFEFDLSTTFAGQVATTDLPLLFPHLLELKLHCECLAAISLLLSRIRLPALTDFDAFIEDRPFRWEFSWFLASVQTSGMGNTVQGFRVVQEPPPWAPPALVDSRFILDWKDLQPCMAFSNLRRICFDIKWKVELTDNETLTLASAWPCLEELLINAHWGWNTRGGITPNGIVQLLLKCPSLRSVSVAIDTRSYTQLPQSPPSLELTLPHEFSINVVDSLIEEEAIPTMAAFFASISPRSLGFRRGLTMRFSPNCDLYIDRWRDVFRRVVNTINQHS